MDKTKSINKINKIVNKLIVDRKDGSLINLAYEFINNVFRRLEPEFRGYIIDELCKEDMRIKQNE